MHERDPNPFGSMQGEGEASLARQVAHVETNAAGITFAAWLKAAHWPAQKPVAEARLAWQRGDTPPRLSNPVPLEPPPAEKTRLSKMTSAELARFHTEANDAIASHPHDPKARDQASRRACWALWMARERDIELDRTPRWPTAKERAAAAKKGARASRDKAGEDAGKRVPCPCGTAGCVLCDDQGMVPARRARNPVAKRGAAGYGGEVDRNENPRGSDWRTVERALREQGWRIQPTSKGHVKLFAPNGTCIVVASGTPSDHRALANIKSKLRSCGFVDPEERRGQNPTERPLVVTILGPGHQVVESFEIERAPLEADIDLLLRIARTTEHGNIIEVVGPGVNQRVRVVKQDGRVGYEPAAKKGQTTMAHPSRRGRGKNTRHQNPRTSVSSSGPPLPGKLYEAKIELHPHTADAWKRLEKHTSVIERELQNAGMAIMSVAAHPHRSSIAVRITEKGSEKRLSEVFNKLSFAKAKVSLGAPVHFHPLTRRTNPAEHDEHESPSCPMCGGEGMHMGALGSRDHFRCRQCGMEFSHASTAAKHKPKAAPKRGKPAKGRKRNPSESAPDAGPLPSDTRRLYEARVTVHPSNAWRELEGELERMAPSAISGAGLTFTSIHVHPHRKTIAVVLEAPKANEEKLDAVFRKAPLKTLLGKYGLDPHFHIVTRRRNPSEAPMPKYITMTSVAYPKPSKPPPRGGRTGNPKAGMTLAEAKKILTPLGIVITRTDPHENEWRVNIKGAGESSAAYESDIQHAVNTGIAMAEWKKGHGKSTKAERTSMKKVAKAAHDKRTGNPVDPTWSETKLTEGSKAMIQRVVGPVRHPQQKLVARIKTKIIGKHAGTPLANAVLKYAIEINKKAAAAPKKASKKAAHRKPARPAPAGGPIQPWSY